MSGVTIGVHKDQRDEAFGFGARQFLEQPVTLVRRQTEIRAAGPLRDDVEEDAAVAGDRLGFGQQMLRESRCVVAQRPRLEVVIARNRVPGRIEVR